MDSNSRKTYIATEEYIKDLSEEMDKEPVFEEPLVKSILAYFQYNPEAVNEPEAYSKVYQKDRITSALLQNTQELQELVNTALNPNKIAVTSSRQVYISATILKHCPLLVLSLLEKGNEAYVLFQFLKDLQNETSLGYFDQIFDHDQEEFQTGVIKFFAGSSSILELCFQNCHHQQVFIVIMNSLLKSTDKGFIEFKKEIFGRFLNKSKKIERSEDLIENIMDMMGLILENLFFLKDQFLQTVLDSIPVSFIQELGVLILENYKTKPHVCQYQIRMMSYILAVYQNLKSKNQPFNLTQIQKSVIAIIKLFDNLTAILLDIPLNSVPFTNSEMIPKIGLVRYYIFILFRDILRLDEQIVLDNFEFLENKHRIIEIYLCLNKWNNMMHFVVEECATLLLQFQRKSKNALKYTRTKEFLDFLIEQFKGSQYIFLGTGNTSSYGNIYYIYNIARAVAVELQSTLELQQVLKNFKPLQKFIFADLQNFEIKMDAPLSQNTSYMVKSKPDSIKKLVRKMSTREKVESHSSGGKLKMKLEDEVKDFMEKRDRKSKEAKMNSSF